MTNPDYTHITVVVDRSGSMGMIKDDAEVATNAFIEDQKKVPGKATFTLVEFDNEYDVLVENIDIKDAPQYTLKPRGMTALLDAWGKAVNSTGEFLASLPEEDRPGQVVVVITTDGGENSSREFTQAQIKELTEKQTNDYNWNFVFLAANQDAVQVGAQYGVAAGSSLTYGANAAGTQSSFAAASGLVTQYRGGNVRATFADEDRDEALGNSK